MVSLNLLHGMADEDPSAQPFDRLEQRLDMITAELAATRPWLVVLQEVSTIGGEGYPPVIESLAQRLSSAPDTGYTTVFGPVFSTGASGPVVDGGGGVGQLTATRGALAGDAGLRFVSTARVVLHTAVETPVGPLDVYNVHTSGGSDAAAVEEIEALLSFVDDTAGDSRPAVLAGDFTARPESLVFDHLRAAGFADLGERSGLSCAAPGEPGCTANTLPLGEPGNRTQKIIDYVWIRGDETLTTQCEPALGEPFALPGGGALWASDHIGRRCVLARVQPD